ncbi:MAG: hypothetical protein FWD31_05215 [Planctomycetaceae bacterium]|nr:hypothetical protein [Planctomycetaceae bacterium]
MTTFDIPTDDGVAMVRAIRDRFYEETKNMTPEEKREYDRKWLEEGRRIMKEINPADYDLSFLGWETESTSKPIA